MLRIVPRRPIDGLTSWPTWRCYLVVSKTSLAETRWPISWYPRDEAKDRDWSGERIFHVHINANLGTEEAGRLLDVVGRYLASTEQ